MNIIMLRRATVKLPLVRNRFYSNGEPLNYFSKGGSKPDNNKQLEGNERASTATVATSKELSEDIKEDGSIKQKVLTSAKPPIYFGASATNKNSERFPGSALTSTQFSPPATATPVSVAESIATKTSSSSSLNSTKSLNVASKAESSLKYSQSYKEFCKGLAYLGVGTTLILLLYFQHEQVSELEGQQRVMKKRQRELYLQTQSYKKKIDSANFDRAKKELYIEGKMQMHIALLREQLVEAGLEPVSIEEAIETFKDRVSVTVSATQADMWIPGEDEIKKHMPHASEYDR
ncbi:hypothetical protein DAMA08_034890 [Martiniozyma asiatica (nom. inval.)]|nr:hypothetical protein DAMA08_034890 [Martiniozyma asiatica]